MLLLGDVGDDEDDECDADDVGLNVGEVEKKKKCAAVVVAVVAKLSLRWELAKLVIQSEESKE